MDITNIVSLTSAAIAFIAAFVLIKKGLILNKSNTNVHVSLERIREVGELNVLTAYIKEVVTMSTGENFFSSTGKIILICGFEIEFRYDLKKVRISNSDQKSTILLLNFMMNVNRHFLGFGLSILKLKKGIDFCMKPAKKP